ncbi:MAG TPA: tetratricopeptide repeat protein [Agitococcus sp.]|nr:tetratricopeptide repeat protein [Agitococcus sp.]
MNSLTKTLAKSSLIFTFLSTLTIAATYDEAILAFENREYDTALELSLPLAQKQDVDAMTLVGRIYDEGFNQSEKALPWYKKAAELGNAQAQLELAELYEAGDGVKKNKELAIYWYEKAADQDHDEAQLALALHYLEDLEEVPEAIVLLEKSAQQGNAIAQYRLGLLYLGDSTIKTDKSKAWYYFAMAANKVPEAAQARDVLELEMTPAELKQAMVQNK